MEGQTRYPGQLSDCALFPSFVDLPLPVIASYGLLLLAVSVTARCLWTSESIHQAWLEQKTGSVAHMLSRFLLGLKPLVQFALYMLPVYFVLMGYYLAQA